MVTVHTPGGRDSRAGAFLRRTSLSAITVALLMLVSVAPPAIAGDGTWTSVNLGTKGKGFPVRTADSGTTYPDVKAFAVDPSNPNVLVAGGGFGLYRSVDRGKNWTRVMPPPTTDTGAWFGGVLFDPSDASIVYATTDAQFG